MKLLPLTALPLFIAATLNADPITLKPNMPPGTKWAFATTATIDLNNQASLNGQSAPFKVHTNQHHTGKVEVLTATDGIPTSIRITFDDSSSDDLAVNDNSQPQPFPYAGKTITVTRGADGQVKDDFQGQANPQSAADLHAMLEQSILFLPAKPVNVGEEWKADPGTLSRMLELAGDDRAGMTLKLLSTKTLDGHDVAEVKVSTVAMKRQGDLQTNMVLQGTTLIDLKTGETLKTDLNGTLQDKGEQAGPGQDGQQVSYHIEGSGTMSTGGTMTPADGTTPTASGGAAGGGASAGNPLGDGGGANPLGAAAADPFVGQFTDGKLTVDGASKDGKFSGSFMLGDKKFLANAAVKDQSLDGTFESSGHSFPFTAKVDGDTMTFVTGGKTYTLKRAAPANPLGSTGGGNGGTATDPKLPGYTVAVATDAGKTFLTKKSASSVKDVFKSVFPDLPNYFDDRPALGTAVEDSQNHKSGSATFTAHLHGQAVRGLVTCKLSGSGADVAVTYCRADADQSQWAKLFEFTPAGAPAVPQLTAHNFPDNTGSISLAEGWTTQSTSAMQTITVNGPGDQNITIGFSMPVYTADSMMVQMVQKNQMMARQMGMQSPPPPQMFIAPFTGPAEALQNLAPQLSDFLQKNGKPSLTIDHIEQTAQLQPMLQGGHAGVLTYNATLTDANATQKHRRAMAQVQTTPIGGGTWMLYMIEAAGPAETFDRDLPTMLAIVNSVHENQQVCGQMLAASAEASREAQQRNFDAQQQAHREQMASYDSYNKAWENREVQKDRSNADFIEVIRGERAIVDTSTSDKGYVNLGDSTQIVDKLNEREPGRYVELPLRDELYPLPGH